jgi:hypothetical protein
MFDDIVVTAVGAVIGSFLGAGGAIVSALAIRRVEARRAETAALKALLVDLHFRRALAPNTGHILRDDQVGADFEHANRSVLAIREQIHAVRLALRPKSPVFDHLSDMTRACNSYLELSAARPGHYIVELATLQASLASSAKSIASLEALRIREWEPGTGAFQNAQHRTAAEARG